MLEKTVLVEAGKQILEDRLRLSVPDDAVIKAFPTVHGFLIYYGNYIISLCDKERGTEKEFLDGMEGAKNSGSGLGQNEHYVTSGHMVGQPIAWYATVNNPPR